MTSSAYREERQAHSVPALAIGRWRDGAIALIAILAVELICFGPSLKGLGFYLDDWSMISRLHFGPTSFDALTRYCLLDSKVVPRPLEAPYFAALYLLLGVKPLGYHIVNMLFEVAGAWFLYLALARLGGGRALSLVAALVYLVYPTHDVTHYWFTASSVSLSLTLYLLSLWLAVKAAQDGRRTMLALSVLTFTLSVYNYEAFIPLSGLTGLAIFSVYRASEPLKRALLLASASFLPYAAIVVSVWVYQKMVLPALGLGWDLPLSHDPANFWKVMSQGLAVTVSPYALSFFIARAGDCLSAGLQASQIIWLAAMALSVTCAIVLIGRNDTTAGNPLLLTLLGGATVVMSYTIFAIAAHYYPLLDTIVNRVNAGASVGAAMLVAAATGALAYPLWRFRERRAPAVLVWCVVATPIIILFTLSNWGLAKAWTTSWEVQKHVRQEILRRKDQFVAGDSIILANTPRYVLWSPLFDGVWDFQSMVRLVLDEPQINGGVVSERIVVTADGIKDISSGYLCGTYNFGRLFVLVPTPEHWVQVRSAHEFIELIEHEGMDFGLDPKMPSKWRAALSQRTGN